MNYCVWQPGLCHRETALPMALPALVNHHFGFHSPHIPRQRRLDAHRDRNIQASCALLAPPYAALCFFGFEYFSHLCRRGSWFLWQENVAGQPGEEGQRRTSQLSTILPSSNPRRDLIRFTLWDSTGVGDPLSPEHPPRDYL